MTMAQREAVAARFWPKVDRTGEHWIWTKATDDNGYGKFWLDGQMEYAHRVAWFLVHGKWPEELDHACRIPACVRPEPEHLEDVTHAENVRRGLAGKINNHSAAKTHCVKGHPLSGDNLYTAPGTGQRMCRSCMKDSQRRTLKARKAQRERTNVAV
jgi:hypothetical protein